HQADYDGTADPPHPAAQFPLTCESCHSTTVWTGATFDHAATAFPLTGAHLVATCDGCHADGVYSGRPTTCVSCHQAEYDATTDPGHAAATFPVSCESCHTTTTWDGATFDHDGPYFPIYSGKHAGRWSTCATCHANPASYADFTCFNCHEHDQIQMDDTHKEKPGYQYESRTCLTCHPRGDA
ncbi:MAG TPA: hypothetical protein VFU00_04420, partial [Gemmatimonadales bacterium]|nr:hypothetical protein [Gemmatimonadales bacterium]